jgi:hypothetical protein
MRWDAFAFEGEKQHSEANFQIWRDDDVSFGGPTQETLYAKASRNSVVQDAKDHLNQPSGQAFITAGAGEHWCFRVRTETFAFPLYTTERNGLLSSTNCIARSLDNLVARTDKLEVLRVRLNNEGVFAKSSVQLFEYGQQGLLCPTLASLPAGGYHECGFTPVNPKSAVVIYYNGALQDTVAFDSFLHN